MEDQKFSVIVPCYNKENEIGRTLQSLISQTYPNFEIIVIDDNSTDGSREIIKGFMKSKKLRAYFLNENSGRLVARNTGMRMSRNEWICWLDADDEYMSNYLEVYNEEIKRNSDYKIFNSGMFVKDREFMNGKRYENGWRIVEPLVLKEKGDGMESFGGGKIGSGSFVFHRSLLDKVGYFPEDAKEPYGLENSLPAKWVQRDKKMEEICKQNEEGHWLPLGNPWGDDYSFFWRLTRENKIKTINAILYIQHVRE